MCPVCTAVLHPDQKNRRQYRQHIYLCETPTRLRQCLLGCQYCAQRLQQHPTIRRQRNLRMTRLLDVVHEAAQQFHLLHGIWTNGVHLQHGDTSFFICSQALFNETLRAN